MRPCIAALLIILPILPAIPAYCADELSEFAEFPELMDIKPFKDSNNTVKQSVMPKSLQGISLSGLILGSGVRMAIIDGRYYSAGQSVGGYSISRISDKGVHLKRHGKQYLLGAQSMR